MSLEHRSGEPFHNIPSKRQVDYNLWVQTMRERFPGAEARIRENLTQYVNGWFAEKGEIAHAAFCSSWIPGPDWGRGDEVYQPIYETMLHLYNEDGLAHPRAGWFFGLILMDVMIRRFDNWECWHETHERDESPDGWYYRPLRQMAQAG